MTPEYEQEIAANLERAEQSIEAAKDLAVKGYHDFSASRAYYAAFYGATAVLLNEGLDFSKHSGVIASIHQRFVKTGKLSEGEKGDRFIFCIATLDYRRTEPILGNGVSSGGNGSREEIVGIVPALRGSPSVTNNEGAAQVAKTLQKRRLRESRECLGDPFSTLTLELFPSDSPRGQAAMLSRIERPILPRSTPLSL